MLKNLIKLTREHGSWIPYIIVIFFFRSGYESAAKSFNPADLEVDCSGKTYMVTGANSGIGKVAALEIASRGRYHNVLYSCRPWHGWYHR